MGSLSLCLSLSLSPPLFPSFTPSAPLFPGTANIEAKQKPVFSSIALNRKGFLGLSPNLRLQAMVRKSRVRALRTASAQPKDSSRMTTTTHERNPSAHPQIAALSGSATKGNASNRKVSRIAQVFPTQLSSAPGRHGDNSAIEARDASSPACRSPAPLDPHTSNQMSASDASFSAHTGGGQSGMRSVQDMEKTLGTLEWDVLSLSDDAIKLSIVLMFDSVGLLIHDMATGGSWEASLQTGAMTEGLGSLTKGALQREYASTQDVMGQGEGTQCSAGGQMTWW